MSRVFKVMVMLVALSLVTADAIQPAQASVNGVPALQDNPLGNDDGDEVYDTTGDPVQGGEGDPDSVGGGYGARAGDSDLFGLLSGLFGPDSDSMTFEEFIFLMMLQFMPTP